jgi:hypothetical protein
VKLRTVGALIDTGKWLLSKLCRRYNDKVEVQAEISGPGGAPIALDIGVILHAQLLT